MFVRTGGICGFVLGTAFGTFFLRNPCKVLPDYYLGRKKCTQSGIRSEFLVVSANWPLLLLAQRHRLFCRQQQLAGVLLDGYRRRLWSELLSSQPLAGAVRVWIASNIHYNKRRPTVAPKRRWVNASLSNNALKKLKGLERQQHVLQVQQNRVRHPVVQLLLRILTSPAYGCLRSAGSRKATVLLRPKQLRSGRFMPGSFMKEMYHHKCLLLSSRPFASVSLGIWLSTRLAGLFCKFISSIHGRKHLRKMLCVESSTAAVVWMEGKHSTLELVGIRCSVGVICKLRLGA